MWPIRGSLSGPIDMHKSKPEPARRFEVFMGAGRRRAWTVEQKAQILAEPHRADAPAMIEIVIAAATVRVGLGTDVATLTTAADHLLGGHSENLAHLSDEIGVHAALPRARASHVKISIASASAGRLAAPSSDRVGGELVIRTRRARRPWRPFQRSSAALGRPGMTNRVMKQQ